MVNLLARHVNEYDIALHISVRFSSRGNVVVRNSRLDNVFGQEERDGPSFPFVLYRPFLMEILAEENRYRISIDGRHHSYYAYRMPRSSVDRLQIQAAVQTNEIRYFP